MREAFDRRRQTIVAMLRDIPGVDCPEPLGAFYVYPSVKGAARPRDPRPAAGRLSAELGELVLEEAEVAVVPGEAFGTPGYVRMSYALGDDDLVEGVTRLHKLLAEATLSVPGREQRGGTFGRCRRRTCTCTSPGRCGPATLRELAAEHRVRLPDTLAEVDGAHPPELRATDERGWFRFQRLYDAARSVVRGRGRRTPPGARGRAGRRTPRARAGWRSRSTRPPTRRTWAG